MVQNRIKGFFDEGRGEVGGFMANPLASGITPAQAAMYQTAYQLAQRDVEVVQPDELGLRWPFAECWN
jgi:hypothetical protein